MSAKIVSAKMDSAPVLRKEKNGVYYHETSSRLYGLMEIDGESYTYEFHQLAGYRGNFASTPYIFRCIIPSMSKTDCVYNAVADLHDWLYSVKGDINSYGVKFSRKECDEILATGMNQSDTLRHHALRKVRAMLAYLSVRIFAGSEKHWGNDSYDSRDKATFNVNRLAKLKIEEET